MRETASGGRRGTHLLNILCGSIAGIFFKYLAEILWIIAESQVGIQRLVIGIIVVFAVLLDVVVRNGVFKKKPAKN